MATPEPRLLTPCSDHCHALSDIIAVDEVFEGLAFSLSFYLVLGAM